MQNILFTPWLIKHSRPVVRSDQHCVRWTKRGFLNINIRIRIIKNLELTIVHEPKTS
jgi:hypothetical protein